MFIHRSLFQRSACSVKGEKKLGASLGILSVIRFLLLILRFLALWACVCFDMFICPCFVTDVHVGVELDSIIQSLQIIFQENLLKAAIASVAHTVFLVQRWDVKTSLDFVKSLQAEWRAWG